MNEIKILSTLFILILFLSCKGQVSTENKPTGDKPFMTKDQGSKLDNRIWVVFQDSKGNFWFGSNGKGIYHFNGEHLNLITTDNGLIDNTIRGIQEDKDGNIFIETPEGISKHDGKIFTTLKPIRSSSNKWKLEPDDLWFGYNANDLYRYDGEFLFELKLPRKDLINAFGTARKGVPFKSNNYSPYAVYGVDKDRDGNIWFGTVTAGAFRYDGNSFLWFGENELSTLPDGRVPGVRSMIQDKNGYFWLSNFISKYKIDPSLPKGYEKRSAVELSPEVIKDKILYFNSGLADENGNLWMTTYGGGVWKYDGNNLSNIEINNGKEDVLLISIYQDNSGILWLGTDNDGVYRQNGVSFEKFEPIK
jgi:ligand-binding sensor domain-containing protein